MSQSRLLISGIKSGSGKTTVTCGLLCALKERGLNIKAFKCGPDYIDPMFHKKALGVPSGNLDSFFCDEKTLKYLLMRNENERDIAVIEGAMGYYDGAGGGFEGSSYDVARLTQTPVILVADCKGMSNTAAAVIKGIADYRKDSNILGVILNRISAKQFENAKCRIEEECNVRVLGFLPDMQNIVFPSRHLGLLSPDDISDIKEKLEIIKGAMLENIDMDALIAIGEGAPHISCKEVRIEKFKNELNIAVARDEAFSFYYEENLDLLQRMGAKLSFFSPLSGDKIPDGTDIILLGGGYPEEYLLELSKSHTGGYIREAYKSGVKIIAECGGYMYLKEFIEDKNNNRFPMCGILLGEAKYAGRLVRFGYVTLKKRGLHGFKNTIKGHEFHHWDSDSNGDGFTAVKTDGSSYPCIYHETKLLAGFPHLYYYSNPEFVYEIIREWGIANE